MSAERYHWVTTDRRTDREILNEIASIDTPLLIVSSEPSEPPILSLAQTVSKHGASVLALAVPRDISFWKAANAWPEELAFLVIPPSSFSFIVDYGSTERRITAARKAQSLWDWIVGRQIDGEAIHRIMLELPPNSRSRLYEPLPRPLVPVGTPLTNIIRQQIERLAGLQFESTNPDATALKAGLFQWHDALDESHECSQSIEGRGKDRAGDYWHAIMHRREPDYGNSKYWLRHVGRHPIFAELGQRAALLIADSVPDWHDRLLRSGWDPLAFVDFCEAAGRGNNSAHIGLAESIQEIEMLLLLASTYADAQP